MYYPKFCLPAGGLPFGGTNFQIFRFSKKWNILHVFAKVPQPKWPYGPWDHFMFSAKNGFDFVISIQNPLLGVPPHVSNYCNIELILFVQTEDNTSYFLRIQHLAPEARGTSCQAPGEPAARTPGEPSGAITVHSPLSYWVRTLLGKPS